MSKDIIENSIGYNNDFNNIIKNIETKSIVTGMVHGDQYLNDSPLFLENAEENNFFFKHSMVLTTSQSSVSIVAPSDIPSKWSLPENSDNIAIENKISIIPINLKHLYFSITITDTMKNDIRMDLEKGFLKLVQNRIHDQLVKVFIKGNGEAEPMGILHANNEIEPVKIQKKDMIESMINSLNTIKNSYNESFVFIFGKNFYQEYLAYIVKNNNSNITTNKFFDKPVYRSEHMSDNSCVCVNLSNYIIAKHASVNLRKKENLYFTDSLSIQMKIGSYCHSIKDNLVLLTLNT